MKKLFATLFAASLMLVGTQAFAQIVVGGGYLNATDKVAIGSNSEKQDLNGVYAGFSYNLNLGVVDGLGIAPGVYANFLFGKDKNLSDMKYRDISLQVPVNVTYGQELTSDFKVFGFAGPAFQFGLAKKAVLSSGGTTVTSDFYDSKYSDNLGRFNVLIGVGAGIEVSQKIQVVVGADFGLLNLYKGDYKDASYKRPTQIKIGVNYVL